MAAFFFDIDGTLWDFSNYIPESTKTAIKEIRKQGHLAFICSGRTRGFITSEELLGIGFDGILCGCGTHIEYKGQDLLYSKLDKELMKKTTELFYRLDMPMIMEGKYHLYMDQSISRRDKYGQYLLRALGDTVRPIKDNDDNWEASKFTIILEGRDTSYIQQELGDYFDFIIHNSRVMEVVPKGYSKATAIDFICRELNIDIKDTYAFGDSPNDIAMLEFAGTGIVMGNGSDLTKSHADYITDDLHEDGIYNAIKHFGFIR